MPHTVFADSSMEIRHTSAFPHPAEVDEPTVDAFRRAPGLRHKYLVRLTFFVGTKVTQHDFDFRTLPEAAELYAALSQAGSKSPYSDLSKVELFDKEHQSLLEFQDFDHKPGETAPL